MVQDLTSGAILKGRYKIKKELARGGMGVVYLASDQELLSRTVVVKALFEESFRDPELKRKFRQEMEALTRIDHPGIVSVLDAGEMEDGRPFLVMQFVEGTNLRNLLKSGPLDFAHAARLIRQIGDALSAAHDKGIFHRDLKPENVMIQKPEEPGEQVKLIDFGLAKVLDSKIAESTQIGNVVGSFGYISPEQLTAKPVSAASDIYSLGVIAYEMLTGQRPFQPDSAFELHEMQRAGATRPGLLRKDLPGDAESVLLKALSFDPENRPSNARGFAEELSSSLAETHSVRPAFRISKPNQSLRWGAAIVLVLLFALFLKLSFSFLSRPEIFITTKPNFKHEDFTLNYSDPRGYRYTLVDSSAVEITIKPAKWKRLDNYSLQLTLSPHIEFADVYFDRQFRMDGQLSLQPSNTNDILLIKKESDDFRSPRLIVFTYKYRTPHPDNSIAVSLKTDGTEFLAKTKLELPQ